MQFHINGFQAGNPEIFEAALGFEGIQGNLPEKLDVLVIGSGPAGLTLAAQLSSYPEISTRIIEKKEESMKLGQADGVSCRSMEMFNAFGFAEQVLKEGYWVNETNFWKADTKKPNNITRNARVQDVADGLSEMPHIVLNQARVHDMYLDFMKNSPTKLEVDYGCELINLEIDNTKSKYPCKVTIKQNNELKVVYANYVVGCDGARSLVRKAINRELKGDREGQAWGVMDVLPLTNFPDIRFKNIIKSASAGNILLIPREGGHLVRVYVELDKLEQRGDSKSITLDKLIQTTQNVFKPFNFEVKEVAWWSVYEVGHSVTDKFDDLADEDFTNSPHVFIAGDACHTHSAKAGQGMNVSMGDTFNLGWKLISVLTGKSDSSLLRSYSEERQVVAQGLIDYDHKWSRVMSAPINKTNVSSVQEHFIQGGNFTAGLSVKYLPSKLTGENTYQELATGFEIGTRFHSAPVIRMCDAKPVELGHTVKVGTKWGIYTFSDASNPTHSDSKIARLCEFLENSENSPIRKHTKRDEDIDTLISVFGIFQQSHHTLEIEELPSILRPNIGKYALKDYEKMYTSDLKSGKDIFDMRGVNRFEGCIVIVRPDQYVAHVLPLDAYEELENFFAGIFLERK